ncbi:hypothetical protein TRICI_000356 [Trichomonascus ciferrii]|uniref:Uncharacterized protein n=1 Tax=Trichomonascus ciferrii TaxID=44093 RepID=A0A642VDM7_9ASCO|nr:hypothetical protein TRICI_000356 [Trichomonascus ciferrii]
MSSITVNKALEFSGSSTESVVPSSVPTTLITAPGAAAAAAREQPADVTVPEVKRDEEDPPYCDNDETMKMLREAHKRDNDFQELDNKFRDWKAQTETGQSEPDASFEKRASYQAVKFSASGGKSSGSHLKSVSHTANKRELSQQQRGEIAYELKQMEDAFNGLKNLTSTDQDKLDQAKEAATNLKQILKLL